MLDIHEDTGQAALRAAGLLEAFGAHLAHGDAMRILDKTGAVRMAHNGNGLRPEIDRGALRNLLLSSLPPGLVRWNARVTGISREESGFKLSFADGSVAPAEILIGADGAWSKVRPLVSEASPFYSGISFVELRYLDADRKHPTAAALVGKGLMFALSDERGILGIASQTTNCASMPRSRFRPIGRDSRFPANYCTGIFTAGTLIFTKCWPTAMVTCCRDRSGCCRRDIAGRARRA